MVDWWTLHSAWGLNLDIAASCNALLQPQPLRRITPQPSSRYATITFLGTMPRERLPSQCLPGMLLPRSHAPTLLRSYASILFRVYTHWTLSLRPRPRPSPLRKNSATEKMSNPSGRRVFRSVPTFSVALQPIGGPSLPPPPHTVRGLRPLPQFWVGGCRNFQSSPGP
jgi:hypothetical protein